MNKIFFIAFLAIFLFASSAMAATTYNITINDTTPGPVPITMVYMGNTSQTYALAFNITLDNASATGECTGVDVNLTITMPFGLENTTPCYRGFSAANLTTVVCQTNLTSAITGLNVTYNFTFRANISAFTQYGLYYMNITVSSANASNKNTLNRTLYAVPFWRNPRPQAVRNDTGNITDSQLIFTNWDQTESRYDVTVPIYAYNDTLGYPTLADGRFADVVYLGGKTTFERPSWMRLWSYNLTFKILLNDTSNNASIVYYIRSPINNTKQPHQTLYPLWCRVQESQDTMANETFNMTICVAHQTNFDIFLYNESGGCGNYTASDLATKQNITIAFSPNSQDEVMLIINITQLNRTTTLNNTRISILFTLLNYTQGSQPSSVSPIYVENQRITGFDMRSSAPSVGGAANVTYRLNLTNKLENYTLSGLTLRFALPTNITVINNSLIVNVTYNITRNINVTFLNNTLDKMVNGSSGNGVLSNMTMMYMYDRVPGSPMNGSNMSVTFSIFDIELSNSSTPMAAAFNNWDPSNRTNASIALEAEIQFPVLRESSSVTGGQGSNNSYNATISLSFQGPLNLTSKLTNINTSATNVIVKVDGQAIQSANYTIGSLVIDNVAAGAHSVNVEYKMPSGAAATTTTASGGSGSSGNQTTTTVTTSSTTTTTVKPEEANTSWSSIPANTPTLIAISDGEISITSVLLTTKVDVGAGTLDIKRVMSPTTEKPSGNVYKYIEITPVGLSNENISSVIISFHVEKSWLTNNNMSSASVRLNRYSGSSWSVLQTVMTSEDNLTADYNATSPGFSYFAITASQAGTIDPMIIAVAAVIIIIVVVLLILSNEGKLNTRNLKPAPASKGKKRFDYKRGKAGF